MLAHCVAVGCGGFLGAVARYLLSCVPLTSSAFPWMTLLINVAGSFALAVISTMILQNANASENLSLFLRVGLCGGFTTFSTFAFETAGLFSGGLTPLALLYIVASVALCVVAALLGMQLARPAA